MKFRILFLLTAFALIRPVAADGAKVVKGESLDISIRGVPQEEQTQINGTYQVSKSGELHLPYMHKSPLLVEGLSTATIARDIEQAYKKADIYTTPVISIVKHGAERIGCGSGRGCGVNKFLIVSGQVDRPGPQKYRPGITLIEVVSAAGPTSLAAQNRVELLRNGKVYKYNMKIPVHQSERVYPNDQIAIKEKIVRYK